MLLCRYHGAWYGNVPVVVGDGTMILLMLLML